MTGAKKIVSWNTGGLKDITRRQKKVELIRNILEKANETLFIGLQETHTGLKIQMYHNSLKILRICIGSITVMHWRKIIFQE